MARVNEENFIVALKILNKAEIINQKVQHQLKREIEIQARLSHPHILKLYDYFFDKDRVYLVLEYAPKGELFRVLTKLGKFPDRLASRVIKQVIEALEYCHENGVIHRDIKPENILLSYDGQIKLSDFGWSVQSDSKRQTQCGTLDYLPPEIVFGYTYDHRVDLWCLGVLAYELLTGKPPFVAPNASQTQKLIQKCEYEVPETVSPYASLFIKALLILDPSNRMPLKKAKSHLWILLYEVTSKQ